MGEVGDAADITAGSARIKGAFPTFISSAEIQALVRKGALEALGGRMGSPVMYSLWDPKGWMSP